MIPGDYRQPWNNTCGSNSDPAHGYTIEMNEIAITCPWCGHTSPNQASPRCGDRPPEKATARHPILELMPEQVRKAIDTYHGCRSPNPKRRERWGTARTAHSAAAVHRIFTAARATPIPTGFARTSRACTTRTAARLLVCAGERAHGTGKPGAGAPDGAR